MRKLYASVIVLAAIVSGLLLFSVLNTNSEAASVRDCTPNSIVNCGAMSMAELKQKFNENKSKDLHAIYAAYGITASNIGSAKMGTVYKDGRVVVDGQVVATDANSIGRQAISGSRAKVIGGKTYYESANSTAFRSDSISAFVYFDGNGQFKSFILTSCGNPGTAKPKPKPKPSYKCELLTKNPLSRTRFEFTAKASAQNATIVSYAFDYGDGKRETLTTPKATHNYDQPGSYTAKVTVNVKVGNETKQATDPKCVVKVEVKEPKASCDALRARTLSLEDRRYGYDLAYTAENGATLKTVDFDFGDGAGQTGVLPADLTKVEHTYPRAGSFTTVATLHFDINGNVQSEKCEVAITISPEACPTNPSLPKDDERCGPCPVPGKEHLPKDSPGCVTPPVTELPKTGPMNFVFAGLGASSLMAAGYYWFMSRRDLMAALLNR